MEGREEDKLSELVNAFKSWIHRTTDPSRDFWMPDHTCRVCYECDAHFTIFNRRHHCRNCGRIFCNKCTSNSIPSPIAGERIRLCNYCFKQRQNDSSPLLGFQLPRSSTSYSSVEKSGIDSVSVASDPRSPASIAEYPLPNNYSRFSANRSEEDDGDSSYTYHSEGDLVDIQQPRCYLSSAELDQQSLSTPSIYPSDFGPLISSPNNNFVEEEARNHSVDFANKIAIDEVSHGDLDNATDNVEEELDLESSVCGERTPDDEDVDFDNNGLLWLPPEPDDEDEEIEPCLLDDDDDDDGMDHGDGHIEVPRERPYLRCSSTLGTKRPRNRDNSGEMHRKAMKSVVEGHFRGLIAQLLEGENLPIGEEGDKESWLEIVTSLSWEAATLLKPDMSKGGGMDPGGYVKVKCVACGLRSESEVIQGVVCKKNVAHRRMKSRFKNARLLLLGGALEYQRVSNQLSCFDTLLQQEMDHLKMAVAKIEAHHPNLLLVEKAVSRFAQDYLLAKDIALVLNVKRPLLERIARCTGAQIVPSIDSLSSPKLGYCELFHADKFSEEHKSSGQTGKTLIKTLMFFQGCPKPLGCTVLLKGAHSDELKKVKHVVQYGVFAAYHLALETSFLADEGASLPELPLSSPITVALPDKPPSLDRSISTIHHLQIRNMHSSTAHSNHSSTERKACATGSDASPRSGSKRISVRPLMLENGGVKEVIGRRKVVFDETQLGTDQVRENPGVSLGETAAGSPNHQSISHYEETLFNDEFPPSPSDQQSILVSLSTRCVWKGTICERAHLLRIKYYGSFDKPLGRFLQDNLFDQSFQCCSCSAPSEAHVHSYTHRQGSLTISVKKLVDFPLKGEGEGKIWMWHRCLKCPRTFGFPPATRRVVMSDAAWGLSFGKFLELNFSNHAAASKVASCGHSLHRDCLRFYGFGSMIACFRYASIDVHSVHLPPSIIDLSNPIPVGWIEKEVTEVADRADILFSEVSNLLHQIGHKVSNSGTICNSVKMLELRRHVAELKFVLQKEKAEFEEFLNNAMKKDLQQGHPVADILEINKLRRKLIFQSYAWDHHLLFLNVSINKDSSLCSSVHGLSVELNSSLAYEKEKKGWAKGTHGMDKDDDEMDSLAPLDLKHSLIVTNGNFMNTHYTHMGEVVVSNDCKLLYDGNVDSGRLQFPNVEVFCTKSDDFEKEASFQDYVTESHGLGMDTIPEGVLLAEITGSWDIPDVQESNLGDGELSIMESLSHALDVVLGGNSNTVAAQCNPAMESKVVRTVEEQAGLDLVQACEPTSPVNGIDARMSSNSPFLNFYNAYSKNIVSVGEYNLSHVSPLYGPEHQGGARLLLPLGMNDAVIPIYDDEPTSMIAYALVSSDYHSQISNEGERPREREMGGLSLTSSFSEFSSFIPSLHSFEGSFEFMAENVSRDRSSSSLEDMSISSSRSSPLVEHCKGVHVRVCFKDESSLGTVKYIVTCYHAKQFDALRRRCCPSEMEYVASISRCKKWGAQGGKSKVFFAKTLDDRFIVKQVTKTELESFIKFAPEYFKYLSNSMTTGCPTSLAKILGIYQVTSKHPRGGKEVRMDLMIMENLTRGRKLTRLYDLKGSCRSRYNPDSSGTNKVLLDQNLIEDMPTSPIFVGNKAKRLLERAVWNDTSFLASIYVMDYSLLVGVDEEKHELVVGIIDFMRQYTWDKHLETWVKASGILGGPKNVSPTVVSPMQYKKRFRKAMSTYFLMVPDQWSPLTILPALSRSNGDGS
ncbi:1-phosphatidylinositol-3-phosphate 5-kinase FAB1B [Amborella trichopoda]|uniref:1-phosphatidylinositol-3-phosphate 5-kinase n=1 Tax=Amborella trichopoda TaxID=13333 RepID=W1P5C2_AMBTC|nr:1-phosphatidylinositol-3-phosphate 5-kinase FAB1B [Amborella trichopoda]XP_020520475.1 1-phosphatidylinositol-3-phosphate 5-kinase FAB1B [Amborella trichopoda]ERN02155.1 hypothetical protein AMTR_s00045p00187010 [Amborella trichopoda]|eukprot:XP_011621967.2 1-phosphatidylinositol-3-phosphate 5-kinase FAB1B [Amborella trichopoda]